MDFDQRLKVLSNEKYEAIRIEPEEIEIHDGLLLTPITNRSLIVFRCIACLRKFRVVAEVVLTGKYRCPSEDCIARE